VEIYTLDPLLRRQYVTDRFSSLIWTERWQSTGDFQLDVISTPQNRSRFKPDTYLALNKSNYVMRVETIEDDVDANGQKLLVIKGRSMEAVLSDRVAFSIEGDTTTTPKWTITDTPAAVARKIYHDICVTGVLNVADIIPYVTEGTFMPASTIAEPIDPITLEMEPTTVYEAITQVCQSWALGFRMLRNGDLTQLYFDIYAGSDRTTAQTTLPPVVFAPEMDNLQNTKELTTIDSSKNVAYVYSPAGFAEVYASGVDPAVEGLERRVLVVNATDITSDNPNVTAALNQRGYQELAKYRVLQAFDGEISQNSQYVYGRDYNLGDLVETRNTDGVTNNMRVTEQIFVEDQNGERSYPTLTLNTFINTGSWMSWTSDKAWFDFDADTTSVWGNQP
jgi:hypothetical protein